MLCTIATKNMINEKFAMELVGDLWEFFFTSVRGVQIV